MADWVIWAALLMLQQASHTASSRAKNSNVLWYTAVVGVFSNGVWFGSQFYIVNSMLSAKGDPLRLCLTLAFYILFTVIGTVGAQWFLIGFEKRRNLR